MGIRDAKKSVVTGVEMFRKLLDQGEAGDNVGLLLRGLEREDIERGQVIAKPGSVKPHTTFNTEVYILTKEEGGRHTPFFNGYRPQFYSDHQLPLCELRNAAIWSARCNVISSHARTRSTRGGSGRGGGSSPSVKAHTVGALS